MAGNHNIKTHTNMQSCCCEYQLYELVNYVKNHFKNSKNYKDK